MTDRRTGSLIAARALALAAVLLTAVAAAPRTLAAHPSVSVVVTPDGRVYFSDLSRVWVLEPDGSFRVAVPNVHAHELRLGADGSVYGEDVQNEGDVYRVRYWRLTPSGRIETVADWAPGHPRDVGFSLNEPADPTHFWAVASGGEVRLVRLDGTVDAAIPLGTDPVVVSWVKAVPGGALAVRGGTILELRADGTSRVLGSGLIERTEDFDWLPDQHALMKPWTDPAGRIYVPIFAGRAIVRLPAEGGEPEAFLTSEAGWSPTGGTFTPDGTLWVLEWSTHNEVRLRRVDPSGEERLFGPPA